MLCFKISTDVIYLISHTQVILNFPNASSPRLHSLYGLEIHKRTAEYAVKKLNYNVYTYLVTETLNSIKYRCYI
jgi:hypothetical protein